RHSDALRHQWRGHKRKIRFVERAPVTAVDEYERAARPARGNEKIERFFGSGPIAQIHLWTKRAYRGLRQFGITSDKARMVGHRRAIVVAALDKFRRVQRRLARHAFAIRRRAVSPRQRA